ncbi:MAG: helix-turn-helix domain-containing protein [Novosphingobium sp.]
MAKNADACDELGTGSAKITAATKIFDTARDLFYRRGIRAVGVDEIVCEAGVTKPSLYRAFKSKDELVAACLRESAREGQEEIEVAVAKAGSEPRARLDALLHHFADKLRQPDFRGCAMNNVAIELSEPGHPGRVVIEGCKTEMRSTIVQLTKELGVANAEGLADGLLLVIEGAISTHHVFGSQGPAHSMMATCDALIEAHLR